MQDSNNFLIPSFTCLREQLNSAVTPEAAAAFNVGKQLLAASEACEVSLPLALSNVSIYISLICQLNKSDLDVFFFFLLNWALFMFTLQGLSGRSLRKLPFLTHATLANSFGSEPGKFLHKMIETATRERSEILDWILIISLSIIWSLF